MPSKWIENMDQYASTFIVSVCYIMTFCKCMTVWRLHVCNQPWIFHSCISAHCICKTSCYWNAKLLSYASYQRWHACIWKCNKEDYLSWAMMDIHLTFLYIRRILQPTLSIKVKHVLLGLCAMQHYILRTTTTRVMERQSTDIWV